VFRGYLAGTTNVTGYNNTSLGANAGLSSGNLNNATALGANATVGQNNALVLSGTNPSAVLVGVGTPIPQDRLHLYRAGPTVLRLHSSDGFGTAGVDFWFDFQGSSSKWRPAFVRFTHAGGFTGGLAFYINGTGSTNRAGTVEGMRLVNGRFGIGTAAPQYTLDVNGTIRGTNVLLSDRRFKTNVRPLTGALAAVRAMRGVHYE